MVTIRQERDRLRIRLRRREEWGARFNYGALDSYGDRARPVDEPATRVFIHITVTNPKNYSSFDAHVRAVEAIGINRFPNTGMSYNRLFLAGTRNIYEGQPMGRRGAHTVNDFQRSPCSPHGWSTTAPSWNLNVNARSYVYCANVTDDVPDHIIDDMALCIFEDYRANLITLWAAQHIHGHRCVSSKSCPGDPLWRRMSELQKKVNDLIATGGNMAITKDDVKTIFLTDGLLPAPEDSPGALDGTNKFWAPASFLRYTVNFLFYKKWQRLGTTGDSNKWNFISYIRNVERDTRDARATALSNEKRLIALQAVVEQLVAQHSGGAITKADVAEVINTALANNVVKVEISVQGDGQ